MRKFKKSVRKIGPKDRGVTGNFFSKKDKNLKQFESLLERDYMYHLEFDSEVYCYLEQPLFIDYIDLDGKTKKYVPDFLVRFKDKERKDLLVEIKYHSDLVTNILLLQPKINAAKDYCDKNSLTYSIITDKEIRIQKSEYLFNIKFLFKYRDSLDSIDRNESQVKEDISASLLIIENIRLIGICSIGELLRKLKYYKSESELLFYIWFLIANYYIGCDLNIKLSLNSEVWIT